jgi:hypothetical protein
MDGCRVGPKAATDKLRRPPLRSEMACYTPLSFERRAATVGPAVFAVVLIALWMFQAFWCSKLAIEKGRSAGMFFFLGAHYSARLLPRLGLD